jgi:hypothetical protein
LHETSVVPGKAKDGDALPGKLLKFCGPRVRACFHFANRKLDDADGFEYGELIFRKVSLNAFLVREFSAANSASLKAQGSI